MKNSGHTGQSKDQVSKSDEKNAQYLRGDDLAKDKPVSGDGTQNVSKKQRLDNLKK